VPVTKQPASTMREPRLLVHHRWMIRRDLQQVLAIEEANFPDPWSEEDFIRCLRRREVIGRVAEHGDRIVGFVLYELHKNRLHILNIAVHSAMQRKGVGTSIIDILKGKLSAERRNRIMLEVRDSNLPAQLFFRAIGFKAISILRDFYGDYTQDDAYLFQFRLKRGDA
jgi:ribosomal-protein-alanine N-acetyltransferase